MIQVVALRGVPEGFPERNGIPTFPLSSQVSFVLQAIYKAGRKLSILIGSNLLNSWVFELNFQLFCHRGNAFRDISIIALGPVGL